MLSFLRLVVPLRLPMGIPRHPILNIDSQVGFIPISKDLGIGRFKEDPPIPVTLRIKTSVKNRK